MISEETFKKLDAIIDPIVDKFEEETGAKLLIAYSIEHEGLIDSSVSMSENLDFPTACKLSVSITGCVNRFYGEGLDNLRD